MSDPEGRKAARAELVTRAFVLSVLVILVAAAVGVFLIRQSQVHRAPTIDETHTAAVAAERGTQRIEACTTPGRACYDRGQRSLARTVRGLTSSNQQAASAAAACAAGLAHPTYLNVYRCVRHTLAHPVIKEN